MFIEEIIERMKRLPIDLQKEVLDYLEFLEKKHLRLGKREEDFEFRWEGCLKHLKEKYSSVELQHNKLKVLFL